jgi:hypothetical protein
MKALRNAILTGVLLAFTAPAFAEEAHHTGSDPASTPPPAAASSVQPAMGMMSGGMMPMMNQMSGMMAPAHVEGRIAFLKTELKITSSQEPLWQGFAEALRSDARTMEDMVKKKQGMMTSRMKEAESSLIERLDRHESMLNAHLDHLRRIRIALRPLYESLDEAQRQSADELIMPLAMGMM